MDMESEVKTLKENIVEIFSRLNVVERVNGVVIEKLDNIKESQKDLKEDVKDLTSKLESLMLAPTKRWDTLITTIISVAITSVIAFFIGKTIGK